MEGREVGSCLTSQQVLNPEAALHNRFRKRCKFYEPNSIVRSDMARRRSRKAAKIEPAVTTLRFSLSTDETPNTISHDTISLGQCASLVNRRFYRAGLNWAVAGFTLFTQGVGQVSIAKIPDTWIAANSWKKGFSAWQKMNREALEGSESVKPRFLDFKVYMDSVHHVQGQPANLLPLDETNTAYIEGEWVMSDIMIPDTTNPGSTSRNEIIWTGANYPGAGQSGNDAVSLIEGYAASRGLPDIEDPNTPTDAGDAAGATPENWIVGMDNEGLTQDAQVLQDMIGDNNQAPYPFENGDNPLNPGNPFTDTHYPGGANQAPGLEVHDLNLVTTTTVGGKSTFRGGNFQGGLIRVTNEPEDVWQQSPILFVHLVPGPHRGYLCQSMQDV